MLYPSELQYRIILQPAGKVSDKNIASIFMAEVRQAKKWRIM